MNRKEEGIDSDILREVSLKIDNKKHQLPAMGNWRNKNDYESSVLGGMILPIGSHISLEEEQDFF